MDWHFAYVSHTFMRAKCSSHFIYFYFIILIILDESFYYETPHYRTVPIYLLLILPLFLDTIKPKTHDQVTKAITLIITLFKEISPSSQAIE
jgi:hypothetical protein